MSGGIAYVLSEDAKAFKRKCNMEMISFEKLTDEAEIKEVQEMVKRHAALTNSKKPQISWTIGKKPQKPLSKSFRKTINKCSSASKNKSGGFIRRRRNYVCF